MRGRRRRHSTARIRDVFDWSDHSRSHIRLEIAPGATLLGSQDRGDYRETEELRETAVEPLTHATDAEDITISGGGTIRA